MVTASSSNTFIFLPSKPETKRKGYSPQSIIVPHWFSLSLMFILEPDQTPESIKPENLEISAGS